jgi:hypothetical protein
MKNPLDEEQFERVNTIAVARGNKKGTMRDQAGNAMSGQIKGAN